MRSIDVTHYANKIVYRVPILQEHVTRPLWKKPRILFDTNAFFVIFEKKDIE